MSEGTTQTPYLVISAEENPLLSYYKHLCVSYEMFVMSFMRRHGQGAYQGGVYEFRLYPNNLLVMVFPDLDTKVPYINEGAQNEIMISLECLSLVASATYFSMLCFDAVETGNDELGGFAHDCFHGLRDALIGRLDFVIQPWADCREPTESDLDAASNLIGIKHPEASEFYQCID